MDASEMRKPFIITEYHPEPGEYRPTTDSLIISCDTNRCFPLLSAMPGHTRWLERRLVFRPTGANIAFIMDNFPSAQWEGGSSRYVDEYIATKITQQTVLQMKSDDLVDNSGYEFRTVPRKHQLQGFILGRELPEFAILYEQGCGKTKVAIDNFAYLWERDQIDVMVVVAPMGVHTNWTVEEIPIHLPERIPAKLLTYYSGMNKHDRKRIEGESQPYVLRKRRPCIIVAFGVESFSSEKSRDLILEFLKNHRCMMVVDESNTIQNPSAKRTEFLIEAGTHARYRRVLNGTPITNGAVNLYAQFKFLNPLILGYDTYTSFKSQYCIMGGFEQHSVVGYKHIQELSDTIAGYSHRVLKKDCLDLPDKIYKRHFFEMTPQQKIAYETVRNSALEELQEVFGKPHGERLANEIALTRLLRLQQISCGWAPFSKGEPPTPLIGGNPRLEALLTLLGNVDGKAIIWVNAPGSIADIALIAKHLGKLGDFVEYHGGINPDGRERAKKLFQTDTKVRWLLASKAAAVGLTLTAASNAFYYTNNFDLRIRLQSEDRNHRIGSEIHDKVLYTDLYTTGIDKRIVTSMRNKKSLADEINKDPKSAFLEWS